MKTLKEIKKDFDYDGYDNGRNLFDDLEKLIEKVYKKGYVKGLRNEIGSHPILTAKGAWQQNKERFLGK